MRLIFKDIQLETNQKQIVDEIQWKGVGTHFVTLLFHFVTADVVDWIIM